MQHQPIKAADLSGDVTGSINKSFDKRVYRKHCPPCPVAGKSAGAGNNPGMMAGPAAADIPPEAAPAHSHETAHAHADAGRREGAQSVLTVRALSGLSGDMMLSGLAALAGLNNAELEELARELKLPALENCLRLEPRSVNHIAGVGCLISLPHEHAHRSLKDILAILEGSAMPGEARDLSARTFHLLAEAEAAVHGKNKDDVTFHEVGALDSILDICLVSRIFTRLKPARFICSPLPLADGAIFCAHGCIPSPAPAVLRMLEGVPVRGFQGEGETVTPTALALLKAMDAQFGPWPQTLIEKTVISYGGKVFPNAPN
ncbi:LarC family nickel insertion protein, partial [Desulfovibrio sp. OttesenSCG-928-A18]|nr:LarC family nickel insertion protein [Desulfovibrio sp. OttesenSCG-928-A18]